MLTGIQPKVVFESTTISLGFADGDPDKRRKDDVNKREHGKRGRERERSKKEVDDVDVNILELNPH